MSQKVANRCVPAYENLNLSWYERDDVLMYFHQLKYKKFTEDFDDHFF